MENNHLKQLINKKKQIKATLTRFQNYIADYENVPLLNDFDLIQLDIEDSSYEVDYSSEREEFENKYFYCVSTAQKFIETYNTTSTSNSQINNSIQTNNVRLPMINLPEFDDSVFAAGYIEEYQNNLEIAGVLRDDQDTSTHKEATTNKENVPPCKNAEAVEKPTEFQNIEIAHTSRKSDFENTKLSDTGVAQNITEILSGSTDSSSADTENETLFDARVVHSLQSTPEKLSNNNSPDIEKAWASEDHYKEIMDHELLVERATYEPLITGNRIVGISYVLKWSTTLQHKHSKICTMGILRLTNEHRHGLLEKGLQVKASGLFIDPVHGFLGASPDDLCETHLLEVTCIYKLAIENLSLNEGIEKYKDLCVEKINGIISLTTNYYYQVQGQMHITNREYCYFVVYINDTEPLFIEEIRRDDNFWYGYMLEKLVLFYKDCIATEIVLNRLIFNLKCKDPLCILEAQKKL
ncbi:hypothetical protein RN001_005672 [Aquatica leii]|uniref:YqaJ viral recombinase domain-containing protein n=1 Tax=Aquatica leii TaxID=1421715 RepID=A0AAN7PD10_9COLE|nr:hypothetical protein RN001_005672 [Aquatica leii]